MSSLIWAYFVVKFFFWNNKINIWNKYYKYIGVGKIFLKIKWKNEVKKSMKSKEKISTYTHTHNKRKYFNVCFIIIIILLINNFQACKKLTMWTKFCEAVT